VQFRFAPSLAKTMDDHNFPVPIPDEETEESVLASILSIGKPTPPPTVAELGKKKRLKKGKKLQTVKSTFTEFTFVSFTYNFAQAICYRHGRLNTRS
jgi:hypothetical protein